MRPEESKPSSKNSTTKNSVESPAPTPAKKEEKGFIGILKKAGFTVWVAVMVIGGALAFIVALFLV